MERPESTETEALPTEQPETGEPSGEQDPANEEERESGAETTTDGAETGAGGSSVPEQEPAAEQEQAQEPEPEDELSAARREREEYLTLAQRTQADFENFRKRAARDAAAAGERAKSGLVRELLPVVDNLERALDSAAAADDGERPQEHLADGIRLVHSELVAVLARNGVEVFDPRGEKFDPELHEALSMRAEDGAEPGTVLDVIEKGYRLNGTVLRPARVVVCG